MELDKDTITIIVATLLAAGTLAWRIGAWYLRRIERSITGVDEKLSKLDDKFGDLSSAVYELRGEVKGRAYTEMEQLLKKTQEGD